MTATGASGLCVVCVACGKPLRRRPGLPPPVPDPFACCEAVRCRMLIARRGELGEAGLRHLLQLQARQTAEQAQAEAGQQERRDREQRENATCQAALAPQLHDRLDGVPAPALLHLVLPSGPRRQQPLSKRRRERYRRHLQAVLAGLAAAVGDQASAAPDLAPAPPVDGPPWAGSLCGVCRGGCCTQGGDTAYLGGKTLLRFMQQHPQLGADAVLAQYLARLPAVTMAGSCIHHTAQGCSLPRDMRSDTCNDFRCGPLALLQAPGQPVDAVVVVQRRQSLWRIADPALDNRITAATLLSADGAQALPLNRA